MPVTSGRRPLPGTLVLTPPTAVRLRREVRFVALFVVLALPVAAVLWAILGPLPALAYLVGQTAFLTFGLRRRSVPVLRLSPEGISYEPGRFQLRCTWSEVIAVERVDLPTGSVESFVLDRPHVHWAADPDVRRQLDERGWDRVIPVATFESDWRAGRIGAGLADWAPNLLGSEEG